jgi:hypothetical protein
MPMPRRAIEPGSGTTPLLAVTPTETVPLDPAVTPVSDALENVIGPGVAVVKVKLNVPEAAGENAASTVFASPPGSAVSVTPEGAVPRVIGSTPGVYVTSTSEAVPGLVTLNDTVVVTVVDPAWLGVANATLASKPAATVKKSERLVIEFS